MTGIYKWVFINLKEVVWIVPSSGPDLKTTHLNVRLDLNHLLNHTLLIIFKAKVIFHVLPKCHWIQFYLSNANRTTNICRSSGLRVGLGVSGPIVATLFSGQKKLNLFWSLYLPVKIRFLMNFGQKNPGSVTNQDQMHMQKTWRMFQLGYHMWSSFPTFLQKINISCTLGRL